MKESIPSLLLASFLIITAIGSGCQESEEQYSTMEDQASLPLSFSSWQIADTVQLMWAHHCSDLDGDGIRDLVYVDNNGYGGAVKWRKGISEPGIWVEATIASHAPNGLTFAQGDLETADLDGDGDMDVVVAAHTGEWEGASEPSSIYWLENPTWTAHFIGEAPNFIKDFSLTDFNRDGRMDLATLCFEDNTLNIFFQEGEEWTEVATYTDYKDIHEGMGHGDLNGDGWPDLVVNGHLFMNPGEENNGGWGEENLDPLWNQQTGDWSRNGTKTFVIDLDEDGKSEVFMSHSERAGYPLVLYRQANGSWQKTIIADSIPACHTLQVADFNLDGQMDVLAGINRSRAQGLEKNRFEVTIFTSTNDYRTWTPTVIRMDGIYNGQAADVDGDGDTDIICYPTHDANEVLVYMNEVIQ